MQFVYSVNVSQEKIAVTDQTAKFFLHKQVACIVKHVLVQITLQLAIIAYHTIPHCKSQGGNLQNTMHMKP